MTDQKKRDEIKSWLKEEDIDRKELALECGVSVTTVNGWLSQKPIPKKALMLIANLMKERGRSRINIAACDLTIHLPGDVLNKLSRIATEARVDIGNVVHKIITHVSENPDLVKEWEGERLKRRQLKAAEEAEKYGLES